MFGLSVLLDPALLKSFLRIGHFLGLILGLGTATFLDLMMLRFMVRGKVRHAHWRVFEFGTHIVSLGLVLLWLTGIGFLCWYDAFEPKNLTNPKIWAKISIVWVLTVNGVYLHTIVMPIFKKQIGGTLLSGASRKERTIMAIGGITSAVSWYFPLAIAASAWLNFKVPLGFIAGTYLIVLVLTLGLALTALSIFAERKPSVPTLQRKADRGVITLPVRAWTASDLVTQHRT